jgi:protocatechuate 3,4-dioxygenase, beta subunit
MKTHRVLSRSALVLAVAFAASSAFAAPVPTPDLTEGPFYTFAANNTLPPLAPANRDNDLTRVSGSTKPAKGTLFLLSGVVRDASGAPVKGAVVELWQTDANGVYYHSGDQGPNRDDTFQHYGETTTGADGRYSFRTVHPGLYTGRIRHFHIKVKQAGTTVLTSQFIFEEERAKFGSDIVTTRVSGDALEALVLKTERGTDSTGAAALLASKDIVLGAKAAKP